MPMAARPMGLPRPSLGVAGDTLSAVAGFRPRAVSRLWLAGGSLAEIAAARAGASLAALPDPETRPLVRPLGVSGCRWVELPLRRGLLGIDSRLRGVVGPPLPDRGVATPPGACCLRLLDGNPELSEPKSSFREVSHGLQKTSLPGAGRIIWSKRPSPEDGAQPSSDCADIFADKWPPVGASGVPISASKLSDSTNFHVPATIRGLLRLIKIRFCRSISPISIRDQVAIVKSTADRRRLLSEIRV